MTEKSSKKPDTRIALRIDVDLVRKLDRKVARMRIERPGAAVTRSEAVRAAIIAFVEG